MGYTVWHWREHAAGIIGVIIKDSMAANFLGIPTDAAARSLNIFGVIRCLAAGFDKQLKKMKKEF